MTAQDTKIVKIHNISEETFYNLVHLCGLGLSTVKIYKKYGNPELADSIFAITSRLGPLDRRWHNISEVKDKDFDEGRIELILTLKQAISIQIILTVLKDTDQIFDSQRISDLWFK